MLKFREMDHYTAVATVVFISFIICVPVGLWVTYRFGRLENLYPAAVATTSDECTDSAVKILEIGGSAADAAITAALCQGVLVPQASGLGGGFLATIYKKQTGMVETLNAREVAPLLATQNMFNDNATLSREGGLAIAVPTELKGLWELHQKYGVLTWEELIEPVIHIAEHGFKVPSYLAKVLIRYESKIRSIEGLRDLYVNSETGVVYQEGDIIKNLPLANTLRVIAREGVDAIYGDGSLAEKMIEEINANDGIVTLDDLRIYKPKWDKSVSTKLFTGDTLHTPPIPSSGCIFTFILNILEGYNFHEESFENHQEEKLIYHRIVEAFKFGFGMRTKLGDEINAEIVKIVRELTDVDFATHIRALINDDHTFDNASYYGANGSVTVDYGTGHISILAQNGDAVSLTSTINSIMGSWVYSKSTGIIYNNEMDDFALPYAGDGLLTATANYIKPTKSPMSSMTPTIVIDNDGDVTLVFGGAGGILIMTSMVLFLINTLYLKQSMDASMEMKRFHHQLQPMYVRFEDGYDRPDIEEFLRSKGHDTRTSSPVISAFASIIAISNENGNFKTAIDPRRGGKGTVFKAWL